MRLKEDIDLKELLEQEWTAQFEEEREKLRREARKPIVSLVNTLRPHFLRREQREV